MTTEEIDLSPVSPKGEKPRPSANSIVLGNSTRPSVQKRSQLSAISFRSPTGCFAKGQSDVPTNHGHLGEVCWQSVVRDWRYKKTWQFFGNTSTTLSASPVRSY